MANNLLKFSEILEENKEANWINSTIKDGSGIGKIRWNYDFVLAAKHRELFLPNLEPILIYLDEEDVEYFKNKYLPKINDEFQDELRKLKNRYNK
jgi:CRISPR/Cas system endoribonuclease Cas6 (RAMP superfamily)